jgi:hypothetical protein
LRPRRLLGLCLATLAALYLIELLYHGVLSAVYPYDLNYGEGYILNDALRLWRGEPVWTDITQFPMVRSAYPPLYLLVTALVAPASPSFLGPRLVSLAATLAIGAMLVWHARRVASGWLPAVAAGGLWVGSTFVYQWAPLARVDMLGLALSLAAVLVVDPRPGEGTTGEASAQRFGLAALLCCLALFTKQTFLAAPIAIVLFLALRRDARAIWLGAGVAGVVGGVTLALNAVTDGQYAQHVLFGNSVNPYRIDRTAEMLGLFFSLNPVAAVAGGWAVVLHWSRGRASAVGVYVPLAMATLLTAGNISSDVNYFLEPTVALALALPLAWQAASGLGVRWVTAAVGLAVVQLVFLAHFPNAFMVHHPPGPAKGSTPVAEDVRIGDRVEDIVRAGGQNALVELAGFAVLGGAPVWIQPVDLQAEQRRGRWTPDLLNASIREHRWPVVVLTYKFLPPESLALLEQEYQQTDGLASPTGLSYFVYRPRT